MSVTDADVRALVERFETARLPLTEWSHDAHLAVAVTYLNDADEKTALRRMRDRILCFNAHHGIPMSPKGGYHETLTAFFVRMIAAALREPGAPEGLAARVRFVRERLGRKEIVLDYYSLDRIGSWEARTGFLEPDLEPLPAA